MSTTTIEPIGLSKILATGRPVVLDVRTPVEFAQVHVERTINIPLDEFDPDALSTSGRAKRDQPVYLLCLSGERSSQAAQRLASAGYADPVLVAGGIQAWVATGLPVVRGTTRVIGLERQVRIAAGSLVVLGVLLGQFVHIGFVWIAGFVGASLVFAGVTGICGMGLLLARMPWNRVASASTNGKS